MRLHLLALPLAFLAAGAAAQPAPQPEQIRIPPELTDPAMADRLSNMLDGLSKAFVNLPVGELKAAAEGRTATPAEKTMTIRDFGRRDDPNFDRKLEQQIAQSKPMMRQSIQALVRALPAMTKALSDAADQVERAVENMPRPDYPKR